MTDYTTILQPINRETLSRELTPTTEKKSAMSFDSSVEGVLTGSVMSGGMVSNLTLEDGYFQSNNFVTGTSGWRFTPTSAELNVPAAVMSLDIPDTTTANSFHADSSGNTWWGATTIGSATAKVLNTGAATLTSLVLTGLQAGSSIDGQYLSSLSVATGALANLAVTAAKIDNATITATQIANATITATQIANATITTTQISGTAAITGGQIASATITTTNISATAGITGGQIATGTIVAGNITNLTITAAQIANLTITASQVANATLTNTQIAQNTITGGATGNIALTSVTADNIAALTITASQIAANTITASQLTTGEFVTATANIKDAIITSAKISDLAVSKLTAGTITSKTITLAIAAGTGDTYIAAGKTDYDNTVSGFILGLDDSDSDLAKLYIGDSTHYLNWTGAAVNVYGATITAGTIQTASTGQRAVLSSSQHVLQTYDSSENNLLSISSGGVWANVLSINVQDTAMRGIYITSNQILTKPLAYLWSINSACGQPSLFIRHDGLGSCIFAYMGSNASNIAPVISLWAVSGQGAHLNLYPIDTAPQTPSEGDIYADTDHFPYYHDGTALRPFVLSGNTQTIAGEKTFSTFPITPSAAPDADYEVANKKYVDDSVPTLTYVSIAPSGYSNPASADAWLDWDLSASCPAGTKYAEIYIYCNDASGTARSMGVRKNGSATNRYITLDRDWGNTSIVMTVELDANRVVERYVSNTNTFGQFDILGYWI